MATSLSPPGRRAVELKGSIQFPHPSTAHTKGHTRTLFFSFFLTHTPTHTHWTNTHTHHTDTSNANPLASNSLAVTPAFPSPASTGVSGSLLERDRTHYILSPTVLDGTYTRRNQRSINYTSLIVIRHTFRDSLFHAQRLPFIFPSVAGDTMLCTWVTTASTVTHVRSCFARVLCHMAETRDVWLVSGSVFDTSTVSPDVKKKKGLRGIM